MQARLIQLRLALMMLTRLPVGRLPDPAPSLRDVAWAYPLVGVPLGIIGWAGFAGAQALGLAAPLCAMIALAVCARATGALHHDGLADFADGIGGGRDRAHSLEIMRDSRIGSYGVLAMIFAVGLQVAALASAAPHVPLTAFLLVAVGSRLAMLALLIWLPPAREGGLGQASAGVNPQGLLAGLGLALLCALALGLGGLVTLMGMALAAGVVARQALRRIGGQTGDVLGATQLCAETAGWIGWAVAVSA